MKKPPKVKIIWNVTAEDMTATLIVDGSFVAEGMSKTELAAKLEELGL